MRWMLGALAVFVAIGVVAYWLLVPPTSGNGWALDSDTDWRQPAIPADLGSAVLIYRADESTIGFGITVFGSSSCPPRLRSVDVRDGSLSVDTWNGLTPGGCTTDAAPHRFGIVVERDRLGSPPVSVTVSSGDGVSNTVVYEELP